VAVVAVGGRIYAKVIPDAIPASNPAPGLYEIVSGDRPLPLYTELRAKYDPQKGDQTWSVKARLTTALGRPGLAGELVDQLDPATAVRLADRLDDFRESAVRDAMIAITRDVDQAVSSKLAQLEADRVKRTAEVTHERFHRNSRLD
jgi:hypothetical protein